jgi:hypothetical protein
LSQASQEAFAEAVLPIPAPAIQLQEVWLVDLDSGNRSKVNESPYLDRLGRGLQPETNQAHNGADLLQGSSPKGFCSAVDHRAADLSGVCRACIRVSHREGPGISNPVAVVAS